MERDDLAIADRRDGDQRHVERIRPVRVVTGNLVEAERAETDQDQYHHAGPNDANDDALQLPGDAHIRFAQAAPAADTHASL
jgi:hypothetical protein